VIFLFLSPVRKASTMTRDCYRQRHLWQELAQRQRRLQEDATFLCSLKIKRYVSNGRESEDKKEQRKPSASLTVFWGYLRTFFHEVRKTFSSFVIGKHLISLRTILRAIIRLSCRFVLKYSWNSQIRNKLVSTETFLIESPFLIVSLVLLQN